jgi:hypothetical protein
MLFDWALDGLLNDWKLLERHFSLDAAAYNHLLTEHVKRFLDGRGKEHNKPLIFWNVMLQRLLLRAEYARFELENRKHLAENEKTAWPQLETVDDYPEWLFIRLKKADEDTLS